MNVRPIILSPHEQHAKASALRFDDLAYMQYAFPALFAQYPHPKMSQQYGFTDTYHLLQHLRNRGYIVRTVQQTGHGPYGKVLVRLSHPSLANDHDGAAELVIIDSHDGSAAFKVWLGYLRFACANGLILGDDVFVRSFKHTQPDLVEQVVLDLDEATGSSTNVLSYVSAMRNCYPSVDAMHQLGRDVAAARFGLKPIEDAMEIERASDGLLTTRRRIDDTSQDLFTVMNVVQENALRQGAYYTYQGRTIKIRTVANIAKQLEINKVAWNSAVRLLHEP